MHAAPRGSINDWFTPLSEVIRTFNTTVPDLNVLKISYRFNQNVINKKYNLIPEWIRRDRRLRGAKHDIQLSNNHYVFGGTRETIQII